MEKTRDQVPDETQTKPFNGRGSHAKKMSEIFASSQHLILGGPWKKVGLEKEDSMKNKIKREYVPLGDFSMERKNNAIRCKK